MSGSNQALLFAALRYLGLITEKDIPTKNLQNLVSSNDDDWMETWRELVIKAYARLFQSNLDIERTTTQELTEAFEREGVSSPDTVRKCVTFFTFAAKDAGIKLSPHIKPYAGRRQLSGKPKSANDRERIVGLDLELTNEQNNSNEWQVLLSKFPEFDPSWPEDLRRNWLEGFERLSIICKR